MTKFQKKQETPFWVHFAHFWEKQDFPQDSVLTVYRTFLAKAGGPKIVYHTPQW